VTEAYSAGGLRPLARVQSETNMGTSRPTGFCPKSARHPQSSSWLKRRSYTLFHVQRRVQRDNGRRGGWLHKFLRLDKCNATCLSVAMNSRLPPRPTASRPRRRSRRSRTTIFRRRGVGDFPEAPLCDSAPTFRQSSTPPRAAPEPMRLALSFSWPCAV
jgi:hypothetical protein